MMAYCDGIRGSVILSQMRDMYSNKKKNKRNGTTHKHNIPHSTILLVPKSFLRSVCAHYNQSKSMIFYDAI